MIRWWILLVLIKVNSTDYICSYILNKSDICLSYECNKYLDPYTIMVKPNDCKTKILYLSFSSYKNFHLFLKRLQWKLGNLFPLKITNDIRLLRIYINKIDYDDQPIDHNELNRLGINIDLYELYIKNLSNNNYLYESIHYDPNDPQWFIIKVQFICNSLIIYDENPCSSRILLPSFFAPQRPLSTRKILPLLTNFQSSTFIFSSTEQSIQENQRSNHLIIIIGIPLLIIFITMLISIFVYVRNTRKRYANKDLTTTTPRSSSIPSISNNLDCKNREYCEYETNAKPYKISRLPSPHLDSLYKEPQRRL